MGNFYTNSDGLVQHYGTRTTSENAVARKINKGGVEQEIVIDFDYTHIGLTTATFWDQDAGGGSTPDSPSTLNAAIPAGSEIVSAKLTVKTAFDSASDTGKLNIGTYKADGTAIDADGIDAVISESAGAIDTAGDIVSCDGAQIGTVVSNTAPTGSSDTGIYVGMDADTEVFTAGEARLVVTYVAPRA